MTTKAEWHASFDPRNWYDIYEGSRLVGRINAASDVETALRGPKADRLREINAELLAALKDENALIEKTQDYLRMYLEPGERRIQTNAECVNALLRLLDGPEQREAQGNARAAIAKAEGDK